ncbi:MAG: hypothetical protein NTV46_20830, partial [Verrucomicrobia bacterium]|nr:hypothetical protein [Verrucomicrobiota bacterium]
MSFQQNLKDLRPLITRAVLIICVCIGGLFWLHSYAEPTGNPDFKLAIDDVSLPVVQLNFTSEKAGEYYPEYYDEATAKWIPILTQVQYYDAGNYRAFVQVPGNPSPSK